MARDWESHKTGSFFTETWIIGSMAMAEGSGKALDKNAMWIEKYRPKSLDDVAAHKEIIETSE